jgi:YtcA family
MASKNNTWPLATSLCFTCAGCAHAGCAHAPSVDIIGSFFPVWMVCLSTAIVIAFVVRYLLARYQLDLDVGPDALFYPSVVVLFTCLLWLIFFR